MNFVEAELWTASRCFIQMKPRFRLAYSAILCSFLPYLSRMAYERYSNRQLSSIIECSLIGSLNGASLMGLCLTLNPSIVASAALIGGIYGGFYSLALRKFVTKVEVNKIACAGGEVSFDSKYVD